ncbi:hypothetical protein chiPu_0001544 [Chiloscyllium punctatum]|uniref:Uncharacterized protein n=1 Tax=Chiloscyllium punctatum TaxID=137246 RepID=A0A401RYC0_CHIPU|nr:hypothetical protein [Chiloscyllium punctatum]
MPVGGQCYEEGPFFPTTARNMIRIGISRNPDLLLKPDWLLISSLLLATVIIVGVYAGLLLLFRKCKWPEKATVEPTYRELHKVYNFDDYSSKGAAVTTIKKFHRSLHFKEQIEGNEDDREQGDDSILKNDEFWDYEKQIDLESFNANTFYQILLKQSLAVSIRLSQHKNEIRTEIEKRKHIGVEFKEVLNRQQQLLHSDWRCREEHHISFNTVLRESVRFLEEHTVNSKGDKILPSTRVAEQFEALILQMSDAITSECQRLNAWALLGDGTGAQLVNRSTSKALSKEELIGTDGTIRACDLLQLDQLTGLITPRPETVMLLANKYIMPVPEGHFLHPQTGKVLPIAGNVCYDSTRSQLIPLTDSTGVACQRVEHLIPYVPHPLNPNTGLPVKIQLRSLHQQCKLRLGGPIGDAVTGIEVPILAVTIHLRTGLAYPLGGTYISPATNMLAPIEIGAPIIHEKTGQVVSIIGVGLDSNTGLVVPLGGVAESSNTPLIVGDSFLEPLSGKCTRISGAYIQGNRVLPCAGGYQSLLDAITLSCETQVLEALKEEMAMGTSETPSCPQKQLSLLMGAVDDLVKARARSWAHIIHTGYNLQRQRKEAKELADNGGSVGMISFASTGLPIPAVIGMQIPDPGGSDLEVPILGVETDRATGQLIPLAGTMEDPDGRGLIPITLGARSIDQLTGEIGPVVGARIDQQTRIVVPITQSSRISVRRKPVLEMLNVLEEELRYRQDNWQHQRQKEEDLYVALKGLLQEVSDTKADCKFMKVEKNVVAFDDIIDSLRDCAQSEAQRRCTQESQLASLMPVDILFLISQVDKEEVEQQLLYLAMAHTFIEKVKQFTQKMRQEEVHLRGQLQEYIDQQETFRLRHQQVKMLLTQDFHKSMMSRWTGLEIACIRLEHLRDLAELCALGAKDILSGKLYCFGDYQLIGHGAKGELYEAPYLTTQKLLPLLKQLIGLLETNKNIILSPDTLNLVAYHEKDKGKLLSQSPLIKLLKEINEQLKTNPKTEELWQGNGHLQNTTQTEAKYQVPEADRPYMDITDAQWTCEGKLVPVSLEMVSVPELVVYRFGIFVAKLVKRSINAPEVDILLASSLPANNYTHNAFRNSFFYQHSQKILFIRRQQLASVGTFSVLLVHCLSHLATDELSDDSNPLFLQLFHQALKTLFEDMFFIRFQILPPMNARKPRAPTSNKLFQKEFHPEIYTDAISDLLNFDMKDSQASTMFAEQLQQHTEAWNSKTTGMPAKDQQADIIKECLQSESEIQKDNGSFFEFKSELDLEEIEEKIDNITMELSAIFDAEQKVQRSMVSISKKRAFLKEIEELETELDSKKK